VSESLETKAVRRGEAAIDVPAITIILPTVASRARGRSLIRAFESIRSQHGVRAVALVVANGSRKDPRGSRVRRGDGRVRLVQRPEASLMP